MDNPKINRAILLGGAFLTLLMLSSVANTVFLNSLNALYQNPFLFFSMVFMNNIIVISLILLGMSFYVHLVTSGFFKNEKHSNIILEHPKLFAFIFAFIVLFLGILRGVNQSFGKIAIEHLPAIFLITAPIGMIEGTAVYLTIKKTLNKTINIRSLVCIFGIFVIAALIEVGLLSILK